MLLAIFINRARIMLAGLSFSKHDKLNRKSFADRLTQSIAIDYKIQNESYVLLLNGVYGTGKTTFLSMWGKDLTEQGHKVVYIDSLKTDFAEHPLIPILYELYVITESDQFAIKPIINKLLPYVAVSMTTALSLTTGIDPIKIVDDKDKISKAIKNPRDITKNIFSNMSNRIKAINEFESELHKLCKSLNGKLLYIFIDELDRVNPEYAIKYLETIKHFFQIEGVVFVITANKEQFLSIIRGNNWSVDPHGYLLKYITREATLPSCNRDELYIFIHDMSRKIGLSKIICESHSLEDRLTPFAYIAHAFELSLRDIEIVLRNLLHYLRSSTTNQSGFPSYGNVVLTFFLLCLYTKNNSLYHELGKDNMEPTKLWELLKKPLSLIDNQKEFASIVSTILVGMQNRKNKDIVHRCAQLVSEHVVELVNNPTEIFYPFNLTDKSCFCSTYNKLEKWLSVFDNI